MECRTILKFRTHQNFRKEISLQFFTLVARPEQDLGGWGLFEIKGSEVLTSESDALNERNGSRLNTKG